MILETEHEVEAFLVGLKKGNSNLDVETLRKMFRPHVGYDTDNKQMPWMRPKNVTPEQHSTPDIPPDAPHGFGIRQPIGEDPADVALNEPGCGDPRSQPEDSRGS